MLSNEELASAIHETWGKIRATTTSEPMYEFLNAHLDRLLNAQFERSQSAVTEKLFTQEHVTLQGEFGYVWRQGCWCSRCYAEYKRIEAEQSAGACGQEE